MLGWRELILLLGEAQGIEYKQMYHDLDEARRLEAKAREEGNREMELVGV